MGAVIHSENGAISKETPRTSNKRRCYSYQSTSGTAILVKLCAGYNAQSANTSYVASKSVFFEFIVIDKAEEVRRWSTSRPLIEITLFPLTTTTFRTHGVPLLIASGSKLSIRASSILAFSTSPSSFLPLCPSDHHIPSPPRWERRD